MIGRLTTAPRLSGKIGFVHIFSDGIYQQLSSNAELPTWELFRTLNAGDIVSADGEFFTTKTGEETIRLAKLELLRKCELGMPDRMTGVSIDKARSNRHLALLSESVSKERALPYREAILMRARVLASIRRFLDAQGFVEVTTPTLIENTFGCDAKPFKTEDYYLRIAPELELKKLVVGGFPKVYEIGKSFRNEGLSQRHNPEFTMLEFYMPSHGLEFGMKFTEKLLQTVVGEAYTGNVNLSGLKWFDFDRYPDDAEFYEEAIINPTFKTRFHVDEEDSPLAKIDENGFAQRFELFADGMELANGYVEQDNWQEQQEVFERQGVVDTDYIDALKYGLPPSFGVGIGIDRLLMLLTGRNIKEII